MYSVLWYSDASTHFLNSTVDFVSAFKHIVSILQLLLHKAHVLKNPLLYAVLLYLYYIVAKCDRSLTG